MAVDIIEPNSNNFSIPVDAKLQEITISVSGQKPKIYLTDPSGTFLILFSNQNPGCICATQMPTSQIWV
jgi:hypothetical protein